MRHPVMQPVPRKPTEREVLEHSYVHYPYEAWCEYCVMHKARQDAHHDEHHETAAHSVISFDFGYCSRQPDGSDKITVLFAHDRATGLIHALPTPAKGGRCMSYLTTELTCFIAWTGHQRVGLRCDNEPATLGLLDSVRRACRQLGISTIAEPVAPGNHQGNGAAERAVQSVRNQARIFVSQLERLGGAPEGKIIFECTHPVYNWAIPHAAWAYNHYQVANGRTAYEAATDRQYTGRIARFGEMTYGFLRTSAKAAPQWCKGLWLGKTMQADCHIIAVASPDNCGIFTTRSVRRLPDPWNLDYAAKVESMPSDFGYAALGSKLVMAKRVLPPVELPIDFPFALSQQPPTPDEAAIEPQTPAPPELPEQPASSSAGVSAQAGMMPPPASAAVSAPATPAGPGVPVPGNPAGASQAPTTPTLTADEAASQGLFADLDASPRPNKQLKINQIGSCFIDGSEYPHEDEQIVLDFDEDSFDFLDQHDDEVTDEPWSDEFLHEGSALFDLAGSTQQLI